jgi:hypothetical protein
VEEIIEYVATRHRCAWCKKSWADRAGVEKHLKRCWYRPVNYGCKTCVHFVPTEAYYSREEPGGPEHCAVGIDLSSPFGLRNILGEVITEPKLNCPSWIAGDEVGRE